MSFANIYCWQDRYNSHVALWNGFLLIRFTTDRAETAYMQPIGSGSVEDVIDALAADAAALGEPLRLVGLSRAWREEIDRLYPGRFALMSVFFSFLCFFLFLRFFRRKYNLI